MKIRKAGGSFVDTAAPMGRQEVVRGPQEIVPFSRHLNQLDEAQFNAKLAQMVEDISRQGELVAKRADVAEFVRYRELIKRLLDEVVSNGYNFSKKRMFDSRGRSRTFSIVQKVNTRLEEMMQMVLEEEADHITLLQAVNDIRGMLVDILT